MMLIRSPVVTTFINLFILVHIVKIALSQSQNDTNATTTTPSPVTVSTLPSSTPSDTSTHPPSFQPTQSPSFQPTQSPTNTPSLTPSLTPSIPPTTSAPTTTTAAWSGCIDPSNPNTNSKVTIGQRTTLCLVVSEGGDWSTGVTYKRWMFQPIADQYSHFAVPRSYRDLVIQDIGGFQPNINVHVASQQAVSFLRRFYSLEEGIIFPYLTAIIDVELGVVQGISWDDACLFCDSSRCQENTYFFSSQPSTGKDTKGCYLTKDDCNILASEKKQNTCDLKMYVVWTGTDANGKLFNSFTSRYSANYGIRIPFPSILDLKSLDIFGWTRN